MSETLSKAVPRGLRIPLWDDYGQAERFAGLLALAALFAAIPYLVAERMLVAQICVALATVCIGLCTASARGAPRWVLGIGVPLSMTAGALALLLATEATSVAAGGLLAMVPAVAALWGGSERVGWLFLSSTLVSSVALAFVAPEAVASGAEPWIADVRTPWVVGPLALAGFLFARSWAVAHGAWQEEVLATHAVLAASEARFKAYVENAHDVTAELDGRGRVLFIASKQAEHYALPVAKLLGSRGGDYIHPDDLSAARRAFETAAAGRANVSSPIRYRGSREGWRVLRIAVSSYRTREGKLRFVIQARDETVLQEAQAERDRLLAQLEQALARIETLRGRVAICATCKDVRNEAGCWEPVDEYLAGHTLAELSHAMCPRCVKAKSA
jgi:PAS domain S-box-containing protein